MTYARYIRLLTVATGVVYALLLGVGAFWLVPASGGQLPPDAWITGYDAPQVAAWLAAMGDAGRAIYLGPVSVLDTLFPPLLGLLLASVIWRLGRGWLAVVPFLYTATDLWENAVLRGMVRSNDAGLAEHASSLTQGKYALLALALALLWMVWRDHRRTGSPH